MAGSRNIRYDQRTERVKKVTKMTTEEIIYTIGFFITLILMCLIVT